MTTEIATVSNILPPYLTVGLHGVRDSRIILTLPKYLAADGVLDVTTLETDGYGCVVMFEGDYQRCTIDILRRGPAMKVEIFQKGQSPEVKQT